MWLIRIFLGMVQNAVDFPLRDAPLFIRQERRKQLQEAEVGASKGLVDLGVVNHGSLKTPRGGRCLDDWVSLGG